VMYGAYHPMSLCPAEAGPTSPAGSGLREEVAVGGPLCESGDIFTQTDGGFVATRDLPVAGVGDLLVIEIAGAYGFVMASNYNSKPLPAEVLVDGSSGPGKPPPISSAARRCEWNPPSAPVEGVFPAVKAGWPGGGCRLGW